MNLAPKASAGLARRSVCAQQGYAMAALLVGLAVMAVVLSVAMPTWSHMIRREKEAELIFRGTQYARAINQYQRKFANASPQNLDVLIEQRMLRKKFRDPFSTTKEGEFQMLYLNRGSGPQGPGAGMGAGSTGTGGRGLGAGPQTGTGRGSSTGTGLGTGTGIGTGTGTGTGTSPSMYSTTPSGGIVGVASKNTGTSIKIYKEKTKYNEWQFVGLEQSSRGGSPSGGGPGGPSPGGIGGREGRGGRTTITTGPDGTFIGPRGGGFGRGGPDGGRGAGRGTGPNPSR